ncbi:MAG: glycosyltransferase [Bacteroidales bacterium]|nr:glycosyltransferase [Bacteroidales bacterium]
MPISSNLPRVSIITVVFNGEKFIERTIQSVINQTYPAIEYIIIDGGSTDSTVSLIKKYETHLAYWVSEPDNGLYDAMNKGLARASGDYVMFLNAGDTFYDNHTLTMAFGNWNPTVDILYGETLIVDPKNNIIGDRRLKAPQKLTWKSFRDGMLVCHQSIIIRRSIVKPYNLKYKIAADFDWVLNALKAANNIVNCNIYICRFLDGGLNKQKIPLALKERFMIMSKNYGFFPTLLRHFIIGLRFIFFWWREKRF